MIALTIFLLTAGICSADNYVGGIPLTIVKDGTVSGGVYFDSYYGTGDQAKENPITIDKTFTLPDYTDVEWAMLLTTVYCGTMQDNQQGVANVTFNGAVLGNEVLNVPFVFKDDGGDGYEWVNDHVVRVTSDYMMWYDVTALVQAGDNTASVHTEQIDASFDGRIKLITLIVAYNDGSSKTIHYWVNQGHDVDSQYSEDYLDPSEDYIGSTTFAASLPSGATIQDTHLTAVYIAGTDGSYTFNGNSIASGTSQGSYSGSNTWDVANSFVPSETNNLNYDRTGDFYKIVLGILTAEYQEPTADKPDLLVSGITVKHNYFTGAWMDLSNTVSVTVENNGAGNAGSFNVALYADDVEVDTKSVSGLAAGASSVVSFDWTPDEVKTYTLKAEANPGNVVDETDETNNKFTKSQDVEYNGYVGDKPLTTYAHEIITGDIFYTYGDSYYSNKMYPADTYTVNHDISFPAGATIKFARLYNYWTWSTMSGNIGKYPLMSLTFDGNTVSPEVEYDDKKGWGSYDIPTGTWAYNVTDLVAGSGTYTTVVTNIDPDAGSSFCMGGVGLLVVYEDPSGQVVEYWINEGADMISTIKPNSGGLTPEEATVTSLFQGSVDRSNVDNARLWTVVQAGGDLGNKLLFNDMDWTGVYDATPYSDLDIDEARAVEDYLATSDNTVWISGAPYPNGDYLTPSNAFLVITYSGPPPPALYVSADLDTVTVGVPTDVNFTVTNNSELVEGAVITLTGSATGSATTDINGTAVISVNATGSGTITATAIKDGFISATTTITAEVEHSGVSSSVSMTTNIIPAIALVVTPGNIEFGVLSPGETSEAHILTLENNGGFNISVTADVSDTANDLFVDGLLLDSAAWDVYGTSIAAAGLDTADSALEVPGNYLGVGAQVGTLMFWAEAE
ncbi:MAG: DUF3344 domain-containing protein [Methanosarcinales archaeon]|nr:DUF3344 domain-containing protein [Methanosarcinales archaeon]